MRDERVLFYTDVRISIIEDSAMNYSYLRLGEDHRVKPWKRDGLEGNEKGICLKGVYRIWIRIPTLL